MKRATELVDQEVSIDAGASQSESLLASLSGSFSGSCDAGWENGSIGDELDDIVAHVSGYVATAGAQTRGNNMAWNKGAAKKQSVKFLAQSLGVPARAVVLAFERGGIAVTDDPPSAPPPPGK